MVDVKVIRNTQLNTMHTPWCGYFKVKDFSTNLARQRGQ